ncbi:MAG TPA: hypothetical protein VK461_16600 [Acidimicrobiales bacterium]|nr:hypothetical protein [Acidimicrobiales bacterium]
MLVATTVGSIAAHQLLVEHDSGSSAGAWGLAAAVALSIPDRRGRRVALGAIFGFLGGALVLFHRLFDLQHVLAALVAIPLAMALDGAARWRVAVVARRTEAAVA